MLGVSHLLISGTATSLLLGTANPTIIAVGAIAGLLPDVDVSTSPAGRVLPWVSSYFESKMPHRSCTHSLVASAASTLENSIPILQTQECPHCGLFFKDEDVLEIDHIIPKSKGGKDEYDNWQLLHRHCHDKKTTLDGSLGSKSGCNSAKPKPPVIPGNYRWVDDMLVVTCE